MSIDLGRRLIAAGIVPPEEIEAALFTSVVRGVPFTRALVDRAALSERGLEEELGRRGGLALRNVVGVPDLMTRLPRAMCRRLGAVPTRLDPYTGTIDVAAADPLDPHIASEFGFHLAAPIRVIRASIAAVEDAIRRVELDEPSPPPVRPRRMTPAFPHGAPSSSPPPPPEDMPIPLVRRIGGPLVDQDGDDVSARRRSPLDSSATGASPPSVSFPSSPPPPMRRTLPPPPLTLHVENGVAEVVPFDSAASALEVPRAQAEVHRPSMSPAAQNWPAIDPSATSESPSEAPPESADEPEGPPPMPYADSSAVITALREATNRDDVVRHGMRGLRLLGRRIAIFVVKRDGFQGWACNVDFGDNDALREVVIPHEQPSILATATATSIYLGPIPATPAHAQLLAVMQDSSRNVAVVAVRAGGRPAMLLIADDLGDTMAATKRMDDLARAAGDALTKLLKG